MKSIQYIDRDSGEIRTETVAGWAALKWLHSTGPGKLLLESLVKQRFVSFLYGLWMGSSFSRRQIRGFIESLNIDMDEALIPENGFASFNDFFARKLKPEARLICDDNNLCCMPADGRVHAIQTIRDEDVFVIKGVQFSLREFLGDDTLVSRYCNGSLVIVRLCPSDYHRFHFPLDGTPGPSRRVGGSYYSVNPLAIQYKPDLFTRNERQICEIQSASGFVLIVEVGATLVGRIVQTYTPGKPVIKGQEKGYFEFGASTLVVLFEPNQIELDEDLVANTYKGYETLCKMGSSLGKLRA